MRYFLKRLSCILTHIEIIELFKESNPKVDLSWELKYLKTLLNDEWKG